MINHKKKHKNRLKNKSARTTKTKKELYKQSVSCMSHASSDVLGSFKTVHVSEAEMQNRRKMVSKSATRMKAVLGDF